VELLFFGGTGQRRDAGLATLDHGGDFVEVTGADFLLVRHEGVTAVTCCKLGLLHLLDIGRHAALDVVLRQSNMLYHMEWMPASVMNWYL
jgi:hypothetical protein